MKYQADLISRLVKAAVFNFPQIPEGLTYCLSRIDSEVTRIHPNVSHANHLDLIFHRKNKILTTWKNFHMEILEMIEQKVFFFPYQIC